MALAAAITTGFPSIILNGRPMAHLGSPTNHGGTIITGSGDTFGGFVFGPTPDAVIINFAALGVFRPDGSVNDEKMATLLADPRLTEKAIAANALVDPNAASKAPEENPEEKVCTDPDRMEELASYIANEMNRNIHHPSVIKMKELLSYDTVAETRKYMDLPWYAQAGATSPQAIAAANGAAAMAIWTERVSQGRDWDHKPKIYAKFGAYYYKRGKYDYFYDIWSNIHYGYVGRAGGLSESVLSDGAGIEQIASDSLRKLQEMVSTPEAEQKRKGPQRSEGVDGLRAWDDAPDRISISIGIKLFSQHPNGGITAEMIMAEVLAVAPEKWGEGVRVHTCKKI